MIDFFFFFFFFFFDSASQNRTNHLLVPGKEEITYYTTEVEDFSLKFDHNINAIKFLENNPDSDNLQGVNTQMEGQLIFLSNSYEKQIYLYLVCLIE